MVSNDLFTVPGKNLSQKLLLLHSLTARIIHNKFRQKNKISLKQTPLQHLVA